MAPFRYQRLLPLSRLLQKTHMSIQAFGLLDSGFQQWGHEAKIPPSWFIGRRDLW